MMRKLFAAAAVFYLISFNAYSGDNEKLPAGVIKLLNANSAIVDSEVADLNGDNINEYLVAVQLDKNDREYDAGSDRKLFIIIQTKDGYKVHSSNNRILLCSTCGGVMGDPFGGLSADIKWFEVSLFGGSREKWGYKFRFGYSKRYDKWQLVLAEESVFDSLNPDSPDNRTKQYTPPGDYGMINFEDFDPENYLGKGVK